MRLQANLCMKNSEASLGPAHMRLDRCSCCRLRAHLHTRVALATQLPHQELIEFGIKHAIGHGLQARPRAKGNEGMLVRQPHCQRQRQARVRPLRRLAILADPSHTMGSGGSVHEKRKLLAGLASMRASDRMRPAGSSVCIIGSALGLCAQESASSSTQTIGKRHSGDTHLAGLADARHLERGSQREDGTGPALGFIPVCCVLCTSQAKAPKCAQR